MKRDGIDGYDPSTGSTEGVLFGGTVVLHGVFDPVITYLTVVYLDIGHEAIALMREFLRRGLGEFVFLPISLYLCPFGAFGGLLWLMNEASDLNATRTYYASMALFAVTLLWGVALVA